MENQSFAKRLIHHNEEYSKSFSKGGIPGKPSLRVAVVTCMDCRIDTAAMLGVKEGEVHVIRNAGGVLTDDALRSLIISQNFLETREVVLVHHTLCGMLTFSDAEFKDQLEASTGQRPQLDFHPFHDLEQSVRSSIKKVKDCPFLVDRDNVSGFIYDVETGKLESVAS